MTLRPESSTRTGIRTRRLSTCDRHPDEPVSGICASCLRERLYGLDDAPASPELIRCRSVSISKCEASASCLNVPRRNSCDVVSSRSSLCDLIGADDVKRSGFGGEVIGSKNLGLSRVTYNVIDENRNVDEIGVSRGECNVDEADGDLVVDEGEFKTMKEYIDLEFGSKVRKPKQLKEMAGNLWGVASVFGKKLQKWGQKNKEKKIGNISNGKGVIEGDGSVDLFEEKFGDRRLESRGRRSCDTEGRFSVDAGRISFDEPRASWDGYMIASTIPRLAPMLSVVENGVLGSISRFENHRLSVDGPMHSIVEDESSSGASGSGQSNSDSSFSMRHSSFDRSSSVKSFGKKMACSDDHGVSCENVKLVITEKELNDWHLSSSGRDDGLETFGSVTRNGAASERVANTNATLKKSNKWCRVRNVLSFRSKNSKAFDPSIDDVISRNLYEPARISYRRSVDNAGGCGFKGMGEFKLERNRSAKFSSTDLDGGLTPFYMTPLRSSKSGKSHPISGNIFQLS